ncbi:hypothetical protein XA68_11696 [Ophiocordyceps unilateralis]|uniref:Reverse transcriptase Ty1/copia-type domain-containing protein n=1 Tax=Ophiocordyceps unilateralis TaxID=268505 RepID=A0A2A9PGB4_OPHUN|nr:hypothetical protein XA68_11696 [Ophiocordyceps unilateralis]
MSDASFADNVDRKSSQGFIIKVFGGAVSFKAGKQDTVTTSTTEAEFLSLAHTAKEVYSFIRLCREIEFEPPNKLIINTFRIKELGPLRWFLGIEVIRDRGNRRIWLSQQSYVLKIVNRLEGLLTARKGKVPKQPLGLEALEPRETTASQDEIRTY